MQVGPSRPPAPPERHQSVDPEPITRFRQTGAKTEAALTQRQHTAWRRGHQVQAVPGSERETQNGATADPT